MLLDMLFALEPKARVFALDTHVLFPETYAVWREVEQRYDTKVEVYEGPSLGRQAAIHGDALWERKPDLCCAIRKVEPLEPRARRARRVDHRPPPRPVADARERAEGRLGRGARALEGEPARRLGRRALLGRTSASATCPYNALHDSGYASIGCTHCTVAGRRARGPLGGHRQGRVRPPRRSHELMSRLRHLVHRPVGRRQDDDRGHRRARARAARLPRRAASTATSCARTCRRGSASRRRTATRTSRASAGSPRGSRAPARRSIVSAISPYEEARRQARALVEEHAPFVEVHVATPLEECARRDPKGLYAKAFAGEIDDFTGVSAPYEEPADPELRLDTSDRDARASRPRSCSRGSRSWAWSSAEVRG